MKVTKSWRILDDCHLHTPAFVCAEDELLQATRKIKAMLERASCQLLYAMKANSLVPIIDTLAARVQGFACSSLPEAIMARERISTGGSVHFAALGIIDRDAEQIANVCDYISFNSFGQWDRFKRHVTGKIECGLRINPGLSFIGDPRYDPCRAASKLGVPIDTLTEVSARDAHFLEGISGIHFHNNCDSTDFSALLATVQHIDRHLESLLRRLEWVNIGGGYLPNEAETVDPFYESVGLLKDKYGVEVFFEPGAGIVRSAGFLVSSVLDLFESGGKTIAILGTTVNHMPEVFEYQFEPDVAGHTDDGRYRYVLAGCTCLAGDVFGEYVFDEPLEVSSRVVFTNAGAYTTVKWHMFNGVNLPTIYALTEEGELVLKRRFTYEDFASRCGVETHAAIGT